MSSFNQEAIATTFGKLLPSFRAGQEFKKKSCQFDKIVGSTLMN
ncbi:MAG: hypothetical protein AB1589_27810 [Cyanobacteriota bacterium]